MMFKRAIPMLFGLALALSPTGCDPDPIFMDCPLSSSIISVCEDRNEGKTVYTCVVADHPFCLERICASWKAQPPVCTRACETDEDCPAESTCRQDDVLTVTQPDGTQSPLKFCVLQTHIDASTP